MATTWVIEVNFDFVLKNVYNDSMSGEGMVDQTEAQFSLLKDLLTTRVTAGGFDLDGWALNENSIVFEESKLICEEGTVAEYSTFTCRKDNFL